MMHVRNFRKSHVAVTPKNETGERDATRVARPEEGSHFGPWRAVCIVQKGLNLIVQVRDS